MMTATRPRLATHKQIMGGRFRFLSDSEALLDIVESAYGGPPPHGFPREGPAIDVELRLVPRRAPPAGEPPPVRTRLGNGLLGGVMDEHNFVLVSPQRRRARVVASTDMLDRPYHLRYELVEFAVFLLAARCQGLVPLHGACVGRDGRGILLLGESGAGKSTLALHSLLRGLDFLSEDAVFVQPEGMMATGVANFLHVRADALDGVDDGAARAWISASPVIQRRSGVRKFEADLRHAPRNIRLAPAPLALVGTVILSARAAPGPDATLVPVDAASVAACLRSAQTYAMTQPGWRDFETWAMRSPAHRLLRGAHAGSSVDAVQRLLA
jgi:hypothetical protein